MNTTTQQFNAYAKVVPEGVTFDQIDWKLWVNAKPNDENFPQLVLHNWIRSRGGILANESFSVTVYTYDDNTPKYSSGRPRRCMTTVFKINHKDNDE